jgi:hypothetical protein
MHAMPSPPYYTERDADLGAAAALTGEIGGNTEAAGSLASLGG